MNTFCVPLLQTKLSRPALRPLTLPRTHILAHNANLPGIRLILVSAPAGFGKTTLLASWCQQFASTNHQHSTAWLALDEHDNDLHQFLRYLSAALTHAYPEATERGQHAHNQETITTENVLIPLINIIAETQRSCLLVLDDYHLISAPPIHAAIAFLLEHMPESLQLAIASRSDPPLPLARLRARNQLAEVRLNDLCFRPDETQAFLRDYACCQLNDGEISSIHSALEGWPAGMQLVAASQHTDEQHWDTPIGSTALETHSIRPFAPVTEGQQFIFAYLADEVFTRQPAEIQTFLLRTSVVDCFTAPLCELLLHGDDIPRPCAAEILAQLEAANVFISPLDPERHWYRYHPLFRAFLHHRLHREAPELAAALHRRASDWFAEHKPRARHANTTMLANDTHVIEELSEREISVLQLVANGASNQQIADTLTISVGTVKSHLNHILGKLEAHNRTEAVARAREFGLLGSL